MDKIEMILRFVAKKMEKTDSHFEKWTDVDRILMDLAIYGEFVVIREGVSEEGQNMKPFVTFLHPVLSCGCLSKLNLRGRLEGVQFLADDETCMALMKRFQEWERRNAGALAPHPHTRRLEWYRQDLILRFS